MKVLCAFTVFGTFFLYFEELYQVDDELSSLFIAELT